MKISHYNYWQTIQFGWLVVCPDFLLCWAVMGCWVCSWKRERKRMGRKKRRGCTQTKSWPNIVLPPPILPPTHPPSHPLSLTLLCQNIPRGVTCRYVNTCNLSCVNLENSQGSVLKYVSRGHPLLLSMLLVIYSSILQMPIPNNPIPFAPSDHMTEILWIVYHSTKQECIRTSG